MPADEEDLARGLTREAVAAAAYAAVRACAVTLRPDYREALVAQWMQDRTDQWLEEYGLTALEAFDQLDVAAFWTQLTSLQAAVEAELQAED